MPFHLQKLYFDCIDGDGNCFILYRAQLKMGFIRLSYSGLLFSEAGKETIERSSFKSTLKPETGRSLRIDLPSFGVSARGEGLENGIRLDLYRQPGGGVNWHCHHPKLRSRISYQGRIYEGLGYAETLELSVKPWKLPIDELRWGRFLSETHSITWINWRGGHPLNKLFYNGKLYEDAVFSENQLRFDDGRAVLSFHEPQLIRGGKLAQLLERMPWLKLLFPGRILNTVENKYKARASFRHNDENSEGWALFELVSWD